MINIAVRVDSSTIIGTGHVMRCLTLVNAIKAKQAVNVYFFCREANGNINQLIIDSSHQLMPMFAPLPTISGHLKHSTWLGATTKQDANEFLALCAAINIKKFDYLLIDHYGIDAQWQQQVTSISQKVVVIDDLADREHYCDYIIDQTFNCPADKYDTLTPEHCQNLLGTKYAMLRTEFSSQQTLNKNEIIALRKQRAINTLLVMFGGTDADNLTLQTLQLLSQKTLFKHINIILGASALHIVEVQEFCTLNPAFQLHVAPNNIAELMLQADFAIGAAGTTSWERCALGLPSMVIIQADNQKDIAAALAKDNISLCFTQQQLSQAIINELPTIMTNAKAMTQMVANSLQVCDGGGCHRIIEAILGTTEPEAETN